ncbi:hypothetical protein BDQ17DRAFT_1431648 [Cyathus striatus]|nr:hypothetical protein BDQ17DRAFT_1431648 [Cyathus striatus]
MSSMTTAIDRRPVTEPNPAASLNILFLQSAPSTKYSQQHDHLASSYTPGNSESEHGTYEPYSNRVPYATRSDSVPSEVLHGFCHPGLFGARVGRLSIHHGNRRTSGTGLTALNANKGSVVDKESDGLNCGLPDFYVRSLARVDCNARYLVDLLPLCPSSPPQVLAAHGDTHSIYTHLLWIYTFYFMTRSMATYPHTNTSHLRASPLPMCAGSIAGLNILRLFAQNPQIGDLLTLI